ncbi:DUF2244 domain-containing protein [Methylocystis sp. WRRC1]|uniref:DUF2244 domain-containing protein n=1 Tax=Methylocystis sp. WRRC1 TaxID=1732014 RepID=UPI001D1378A6|nr:DUF2244 domain-containing protein [Methylocystis sp. WRRC1]MCC3246940.1 DUF2244 domain-containing protein [Methylocystis sp. WRRC1]
MSDPFERKIYEARLSPHRSMTPRAFYLFIVVYCVAQLVFALPFLFMGAWPVAGFMGLDALALYIAFRISFRSAGAYETLDLTALELVFAQVDVGGRRREWRFNPSWVRLQQDVHEEFGTQSVALVSRGEIVEIGAFLGPEQKAELARDLDRALATARRGPRFE